jgi:FlaA1/EpsC-like NDP-sugar epimerase
MHVTLGAAVVVIVLDPILIFWMGLGLDGAAIATVFSRVAIMVIGFDAVSRVHGMIERPTLAGLHEDIRPLLLIALPAIATNAATPVANAIVTAAFAPYGDSAVAGWAVIGRVQPVAFGFVFAMSGTVGPIIGQNLGAGLHQRMSEAFAASLRIAAVYTLGAWLVLALSAPVLIAAFQATGDGAALIRLYCVWLAPIFGLQSALFVANSVFNTLGRPRVATVINWARAILGTLPFTALGGAIAGSAGVLAGNLLGGAAFSLFAVWLARRYLAGAGASRSPAGDGAEARLVAPQGYSIFRAASGRLAGLVPARPGPAGKGRQGLDQRNAIAGEMVRWREWAVGLPRQWKRLILAIGDFALLSFAVWLALSLRYNEPFVPPTNSDWLVLLAAPAIGVATFSWFGLYRLVTRFITIRGSTRILQCIGVSVMLWAMLVLALSAHWIPRAVILFLYPLVGGILIFASRQVFAALLRSVGVPVFGDVKEPRPVVIYGAGRTGVQLLDALHRSGESRVAGFLDDNASLWGQYAGGVKIYRPDKLARLIEREEVREVILALPERRRRERSAILKQLQRYPVRVKTLPDMEDFAAGRAAVSDLRPIDVDDLLGRDPAPADAGLLAHAIRGKSVLVTGAGGSIGSELVRQVLRQGPARLVLLDLSEVALYEIETEVADAIVTAGGEGARTEVVSILGSVLDADLVRRALDRYRIATVFHAAAYKHVPIVESNPVAGITNNTFGTRILAEAARAAGVERFVLISTDKAVRPTNVMGASKRLSELVLQAHAADPACRTVFTMVRFGNVLDSSGSVVRRFRKQIQEGGPVTVTHKEVVRYFMSIPEAATLVLQAGAMASGGEVFVLDMGEQVKIDELARSMIRLMGLEVRDSDNPEGDVAIEYIGLRPGEKLFEELLIGETTTPTRHPLIRRSSEPHLSADELGRELAVLSAAMGGGRIDEIEAVLERTVEGYRAHIADETGAAPPLAVEPASRTLH